MKTQTNPTQDTKHESGNPKVLTLYLNLDQSVASNLNRGFEALLDSKLREAESRLLEEPEKEAFRRCAGPVRRLLNEHHPGSVSLVVFSPFGGTLSFRELNVAVDTEVRWQDHPYIQPLLESKDEFQEMLVVLLDGSHARLLTRFLGRMTERQEIVNPYPTAHTKAPGHDRMKSQTTFHRKSDEHERKYLRVVADVAETMAGSRKIHRIVLAGNNTATKELYSLLPKEIQKLVVSFTVLPASATSAEISDIVAKVQYQAEREQELAKVESLLDRSRGNGKAVVGVDAVMEALTQGSVHELVYAKGLSLVGARCEACGALSANRKACPQCQKPLNPSEDAIDLSIDAALEIDASIEQIRGNAAERLLSAGGIGAFLRF